MLRHSGKQFGDIIRAVDPGDLRLIGDRRFAAVERGEIAMIQRIEHSVQALRPLGMAAAGLVVQAIEVTEQDRHGLIFVWARARLRRGRRYRRRAVPAPRA